MKTVASIADAVQELRDRGFINTFNIQNHGIYCLDTASEVSADDLTLVEQYHVDSPEADASNTHDVYALTGKDDIKGIMLGTYSEYDAAEFAELFSHIHKNSPQAEA
jgi:hypothetical protein